MDRHSIPSTPSLSWITWLCCLALLFLGCSRPEGVLEPGECKLIIEGGHNEGEYAIPLWAGFAESPVEEGFGLKVMHSPRELRSMLAKLGFREPDRGLDYKNCLVGVTVNTEANENQSIMGVSFINGVYEMTYFVGSYPARIGPDGDLIRGEKRTLVGVMEIPHALAGVDGVARVLTE